jgi:oligopeptide transport system permease protein
MAYVLRRLLEMVPVLLVVVVATFFLAHAVPGGPFDKDRPLPAEVKARLEAYYGLDQPLPKQLGNYVVHLAQGDLGPSLKYPGWTVREVIGSRIGVSCALGFVALFIAVLIGVPVGVLAASRPNSWLDRVPMGFTLVGICVPSFVLGPILALIFALGLGWLPPCGWGSPEHFILPAATLGLITAAPLARLTRGSLMEVRSLDYVRTARAKGVPPLRVWFVHALRNALLPVVTYLGPAAAGLVSGSFVVESLFDVPGMGRLFVTAIINRDVMLILGTTIVYAAALLFLNLAADLANAALNPKVARGR